jgi:hypothetical protein
MPSFPAFIKHYLPEELERLCLEMLVERSQIDFPRESRFVLGMQIPVALSNLVSIQVNIESSIFDSK